MSKTIRFLISILKNTFKTFFEVSPFNYSATVAFYAIFSLPAVLLSIIFIGGAIFDTAMVQSQLFTQIRTIIGANNLEQIKEIIDNTRISNSFTEMNIVGIVLFLFSTTTIFIALQDSINLIWHIKPKPRNAYLKFIINRLLSFGMVVCFGFIMLIFLIIDTLMAILENYIVEKFSSQFVTFIEIMNFSISAIIVMIIFTLIFVVLPDVKPLWKPTLLGALVTTVLFILGKFGINFYLQHSAFTTTYGAAGSFVAILLWIYYSCLLLFLGAAFIKAYANETGNPIKVAKNAVRVETTEVEKKEN